MQGNNGALFIMTLVANFAISERFVVSVCVSAAFFVVGKLLDYFVKPIVETWLSERRKRRAPVTQEAPLPVKRRIGF